MISGKNLQFVAVWGIYHGNYEGVIDRWLKHRKWKCIKTFIGDGDCISWWDNTWTMVTILGVKRLINIESAVRMGKWKWE